MLGQRSSAETAEEVRYTDQGYKNVDIMISLRLTNLSQIVAGRHSGSHPTEESEKQEPEIGLH